MNIIEVLEQEQLRSDIPDFRAGDTVKVYVKVVEGTRERVQMYEGVVIARSGAGVRPQPTFGENRSFPSWYRSQSKTLLSAQPYR